MQNVESGIRDFIADNFLFGQSIDALESQASLLEAGLIDSTGVLELVTFLEDRFAIGIEDDELVPENLDSVERLVNFVESKLQVLKS